MNLLRAEWTKLRTVRGWVVALFLAGVAIVGIGVAPGLSGNCHPPQCALPTGPGGEEVTDVYSWVHRPLSGDGSVTVRVAAFGGNRGPGGEGLVPWAKAGLMVRAGTQRGASYAAVMVTGAHGVRMQHDFTHDRAGSAAATVPRWLRITRTGGAVTGEESDDGVTWRTVATVRPARLPSTVEVGMFVTSPQFSASDTESFGRTGVSGGPSEATASFDSVAPAGGWSEAGGSFTVTGSGDVAPAVSGPNGLGTSLTQTLVGTFLGLVFVVVVAALCVTAEYRHGTVRTTFLAEPRRLRVLAAKALVVGAAAFVLGTAAAVAVVTLGAASLRGNGVYVNAVPALVAVRLVVGTGGLLAVCAVLALALGTLLRRSATAVTAALLTMVLPYLLAVAVLPLDAARWLLRLTPAAGFAVQQSALEYDVVDNLYTPSAGYFPLPPWGGFAVLLGWTALASVGAAYRLTRSDA
ncbi:hypothetical protein Val02_29530 [Virgisporangium aliadipatigenens]|uniref:DUF1349 domain-containing protein n=1 Tax=Virgisporangium aliadipatigenens TaxID=741659 RepID=A0A8J3YKG5_9ACTN|nr:ABC transporter permease subunit [Virgisporangium aliadipatigenens]GIJ46067.1 hypothetical protein Val02_29530 [Virgisporangium aliadipatigenens]